MSKQKTERRFAIGQRPELRAEDDKPVIHGYAAMFDQETDLFWFREKIAAGAFKRALEEQQDVRGLLNHDPNLVLGRTAAGTLRLSEDDKGLMYEIDAPDTTVGRDTAESIRRGDISQSSFAFIVRKETWIEEGDESKTLPLRIIEDVDLFDVSPVTFPAYDSTSVSVRVLIPEGLPEAVFHKASSSLSIVAGAVRAGAVLNKQNRDDLVQARDIIQGVLERADKESPQNDEGDSGDGERQEQVHEIDEATIHEAVEVRQAAHELMRRRTRLAELA